MRKLSLEQWQTWLDHNGYEWEYPRLRLTKSSHFILDKLAHRTRPDDFPRYIASIAGLGGFEGQRMLWIVDTEIWKSDEEDGLRHLRMLTSQPSDGANESAFRCFLFEQSEWEGLKPILCVPILYSWDAYLLTEGGQSLTQISHDGFIRFCVSHDSTIDAAYLESIAQWKYDT